MPESARRKYGTVTPAVVECLREGPAMVGMIAEETGLSAAAVKTALHRGKGVLFQVVGDVRQLLLSAGERFPRSRPDKLWALIDDYPANIPGCPD